MRFDGKVAVVTGAGRGLGREQALLLARRGARVIVNDLGGAIDGTMPSQQPANEVVDSILAEGFIAEPDFNDVSTPAGIRSLVDHAVTTFGAIDVLVCNAGTIVYGGTPDLLDAATFDRLHDLMVSGVGLLVGAAWPHLARSGEGRVILMSSSGGVFGIPANATYGAAKGGVIGLLRCLAIDGGPLGIKVNAVCPLAISRLFEGFSDDQAFNDWFAANARPEYVAPLVGYLAHRDCEPTGRVFNSGMGHVAEIFTGLTQGWKQQGHAIEDIRDHFDAITDRAGYAVPATALESTGLLFADAPLAG